MYQNKRTRQSYRLVCSREKEIMCKVNFSEWEVGEAIDNIGAHATDYYVEVTAEVDGIEYSATGTVSCGDLIDVDDSTIEIIIKEKPASVELMVLVNYLSRLSLLEKTEVDRVRTKMFDLIAQMEREQCKA